MPSESKLTNPACSRVLRMASHSGQSLERYMGRTSLYSSSRFEASNEYRVITTCL